MTFTAPRPTAASVFTRDIDHLMAQSILDRLGFTLQDLSLDYGDIGIENGEISHQLWYDTIDNASTILGYIRVDNGIYYTSGNNNYPTPEQCALELINTEIVKDCQYVIELERAMAVDYM